MNRFYYTDSSALVKRHVAEIGSLWVRNEFDAASGNTVATARLSIVEVLGALNRRKREASLSATDYQLFSGDFLKLAKNEYEIIELNDAVVTQAQRLLENYPLRAADAIQLASAVVADNRLRAAKVSPLIFLASDARLLAAATGENLLSDNPLNHP